MMVDPYVDQNGILKNKLNISSRDLLRQAEADIGFLKLISVDSIDFDSYDELLIKKIHHHIFEDIYEWAGEYRTVPLVKEEVVLPGYSIPYTDYQNIPKELKKKLIELNYISWEDMNIDELVFNFARKIALIWKVHPFRDGNTRTMLAFSFLFAKEHGFPFDIELFTNELNREYLDNGKVSRYSIRDKFVLACLDEKDYPEVSFLADVFKKAIVKNNVNDKKSENVIH